MNEIFKNLTINNLEDPLSPFFFRVGFFGVNFGRRIETDDDHRHVVPRAPRKTHV